MWVCRCGCAYGCVGLWVWVYVWVCVGVGVWVWGCGGVGVGVSVGVGVDVGVGVSVGVGVGVGVGVVSWCHGIFCRVPPPQERLPVVSARPEQHNIAARAMPCRAALVPPPPHPQFAPRSGTHGPGSPSKLCMGTRPMPLVLPKVIHSAWAHAQCL